MKKLTVLILVINTITGFSQEESPLLNHEIGINLAPFMVPLYTPDRLPDRIELSYVYHFNPKYHLRTKLSASRLLEGAPIEPSTIPYFRDTLSQSASVINVNEHGIIESNKFRVYLSVERDFDLGPVQLYGGLGIIPGVIRNAEFVYNVDYLKQAGTEYFQRSTSVYAGSDYFLDFMIGAFPYLGLKIPVGKDFFINFQTGVEWDYKFNHLRPIGTYSSYKSFYGELIVLPVMGEMGVYWRF